MDTIILDIWYMLQNLFLNEGLLILFTCLIIGMIIKGTVNKIPNKIIPGITAGVGVLLTFLIGSFIDDQIIVRILKGAIIGWSSVGLYECLCLIISKRFSIDLTSIFSGKSSGKTKKVKKKAKVTKEEVIEVEETLGYNEEEIIDNDEPVNVDDEE